MLRNLSYLTAELQRASGQIDGGMLKEGAQNRCTSYISLLVEGRKHCKNGRKSWKILNSMKRAAWLRTLLMNKFGSFFGIIHWYTCYGQWAYSDTIQSEQSVSWLTLTAFVYKCMHIKFLDGNQGISRMANLIANPQLHSPNILEIPDFLKIISTRSEDNPPHHKYSKVVSTHLWNTSLNLYQQVMMGFLS